MRLLLLLNRFPPTDSQFNSSGQNKRADGKIPLNIQTGDGQRPLSIPERVFVVHWTVEIERIGL